MKKVLLYIGIVLATLSSCDYNEKYFEGFDELDKPLNLRNGIEYTLTEEDYTTVASNSINKDLAKSEGVDKELGYVGTDKCFSEDIPVEKYAPAFLLTKWYALDKGSTIKLMHNVKGENEPVTKQFSFDGLVWRYDPSITVVLPPDYKLTYVKNFYQAIADYVGDKYGKDYYKNGKYTNEEFYYGASAYRANVNFNIPDWRNGCPAGASVYSEKTDEELKALMMERLPEAFIPALEKYYGDMQPVDKVEVTCTIQFAIYEGEKITDVTHQIEYKVIGKGQFEYIPNSFKKLK